MTVKRRNEISRETCASNNTNYFNCRNYNYEDSVYNKYVLFTTTKWMHNMFEEAVTSGTVWMLIHKQILGFCQLQYFATLHMVFLLTWHVDLLLALILKAEFEE
jgi:hypothetical protein